MAKRTATMLMEGSGHRGAILMRMAGPDIVLFVVGALLFGGAALAIANTEGGLGGDASALGIYNVDYAAKSLEVGTESVADFRNAEATFEVTTLSVGKIVVVVDCNDAANTAVPFTLQVQVEGPNGLKSDPVSGNCAGETSIEIPVSAQPPATTVRGSTTDEAQANLPQSGNETRAVGTWTVTVTGGRSGAPVGIPVGSPGGSITLNAEQWEARLTPVQK